MTVTDAEVEAAAEAVLRVPILVGTYERIGIDDATPLARAALEAAARVRGKRGATPNT